MSHRLSPFDVSIPHLAEQATRAILARREGNLRREENALVHMLHAGPMSLVPDRASMVRNGVAFAWTSTLHALERKRLVERLQGGTFTLSDTGHHRALEIAHRRGLVE